MKWIFLIVLLISGGILGYLYFNIDNVDVSLNTFEAEVAKKTVIVNQAFKDGIHRLSGEIKLAHSCYTTDAKAEMESGDVATLVIKISTNDRSADWSPCANYKTAYEFYVIAEAPERVPVALEIDGIKQLVRVNEVAWESDRGVRETIHL